MKVRVLQAASPLSAFLKASFSSTFCSHALVIALINYISLVALETEVRECITWVQRTKFMTESRQERKKEGWKEGWRKCLLRDQPCVRLASGDSNTSDAAGATILPFTTGEGDKRTLTKGMRERVWEGLACLHSPQAQQPHLQVQHLQMKARTKRWMFVSYYAGVKAPLKNCGFRLPRIMSSVRQKLIITVP